MMVGILKDLSMPYGGGKFSIAPMLFTISCVIGGEFIDMRRHGCVST